MTDRIFIENLRVSCRIGITPLERSNPQDVVLDVSLEMSLAQAGEGDDLTQSIDYKDAMKIVSGVATAHEFKLLEGLVDAVARRLFRSYTLERVRVRARKAKYTSNPSVGVEIERTGVSRESR